MFGWLAHAFASLRPSCDAASWSISRCRVPIAGTELAQRLPMLGSVLYLPARCVVQEPWPVPAGWLAARCELAPVLRSDALIVSSMIGADGPREWIDCVDGQGRFCARVHLLPDTDYLAWDALLAGSQPLPATPLCPDQMACRAASAELVCFRTRRLGQLDLLETLRLGHLSALGRHIAHEAARTAAVELEPARG
ncbi:hypothetical protein [Dyella jiangningensis]|uniref:Uncharacterized protein n=1 Tax=Dyella jiangningensis TaxID=1379159 RepID=A0A328P6Z7_9GAMM|nr:hypothetical protein [Dyella jiangningensis]RAO77083.1 hypothetical protein CA260_04060 [Dyella jiangningensis]